MKLGVNVDHVATLRQARGTPYPDPVEAAKLAAAAGAHGITVHLREDRRHIQDADVFAMRRDQPLPLNLEMALTSEMIEIALKVRPDEVCLVPEKRAELTTEGGLDAAGLGERLREGCDRLRAGGIAVSLFLDPDPLQIRTAAALGVPLVELHTGAFCEAAGEERMRRLEGLREAAVLAHSLGLQVNAGHGLHQDNVRELFAVPHLYCLNIGHSLVSRAVMIGMRGAVAEMIERMRGYRG